MQTPTLKGHSPPRWGRHGGRRDQLLSEWLVMEVPYLWNQEAGNLGQGAENIRQEEGG